jgi:hypothetical protein
MQEKTLQQNEDLTEHQKFTTGMITTPIVERNTKDRLFRYIFNKDRKALLQLYNALNGSHYTDAEQLEIVTLEGVLYMTMKNDLAFILAHYLNMYEQQTSYNPNLPLRFLLYISQEYQKLTDLSEVNLYGSRLIKLPTPKCVVFYSGTKAVEDDFVLSLSDAFVSKGKESDLELKVRVLNIYKGHNKALMQQCKRLEEYSRFIAKIDEGLAKGMGSQQAIETAINYCIDHNIMSDILSRNRAVVIGMLLMEYDEQKTLDYLRKEALEDGIEQGIELSTFNDIRSLMESMNLSAEEAVKALKVPKEKREYYIGKLQVSHNGSH